jgi:hypothetical protein
METLQNQMVLPLGIPIQDSATPDKRRTANRKKTRENSGFDDFLIGDRICPSCMA